AIAQALEKADMTVGDVDGIAVGVGPGSYTGIRIAVTTAKTLAWAQNIPVLGVSSLHALAWGGLQSGWSDASPKQGIHWVIPLLDARRGQVYTALFAADASDEQREPQRLEPDAIRLMHTWTESLIERMSQLPGEQRPAAIWFVGETEIHAETARRLEHLCPNMLHIHPYSLEGRWMGYLGAKRLLAGETDDTHTLVPNYTQLSEAEANLLRKR
ncbi:tRNA (adenosine(37)-N6)-threonylcarbamoyltransferase complex dimerization subunit type 1 TsaB, partial [Peribacillus sp. NPDC056705]|uniref:tRNA (adenosine(37)-N6)-threonylcarbamoyltransferase complex dimerization subunit type 1 TsaB n=1 Tax=Peribacillus sp. NPDC056705 TaxID=3345918 RepID=UPI0037491050